MENMIMILRMMGMYTLAIIAIGISAVTLMWYMTGRKESYFDFVRHL